MFPDWVLVPVVVAAAIYYAVMTRAQVKADRELATKLTLTLVKLETTLEKVTLVLDVLATWAAFWGDPPETVKPKLLEALKL